MKTLLPDRLESQEPFDALKAAYERAKPLIYRAAPHIDDLESYIQSVQGALLQLNAPPRVQKYYSDLAACVDAPVEISSSYHSAIRQIVEHEETEVAQ